MSEELKPEPRNAREIAANRLARQKAATAQSEAVAEQERAGNEQRDAADKVATALSSIRSIDEKLGSVNQLLSNLNNSNVSAGTAVNEARTSYSSLVDAETEIATLIQDPELQFPEQGIGSRQDFLAAEDYKESEQAVNLNQATETRSIARSTARERVAERRGVKIEARKMIDDEGVPRAERVALTYGQVVADLKRVEAMLQSQRVEFVQEVPWMKEAEMQERISKILPSVREHSQTVNGFKSSNPLTGEWDINRTPTLVDEFALKSAKELGENGDALVKGEIKSYFGGVIENQRVRDTEVARNAAEMQSVATLESLSGHWQRVGEQLRQLEATKKETEEHLGTRIESDPKLQTAIRRRYRELRSNATAKQAAAHHLDIFSIKHAGHLGVTNLAARNTDGTVESIYTSSTIKNQLLSLDSIRQPDSRRSVQFLDASQAEQVLGAQGAFYEKLRAALDASPQLLEASLSTPGGQADPLFDAAKATEEEMSGVKIDKYQDGPKVLFIAPGVADKLSRGQPLPALKSELKLEKQVLDKVTAELQKQIDAKIDVDYLQAEVSVASQDKDKIKEKSEVKRLSEAVKAAGSLWTQLVGMRVSRDFEETKINVAPDGSRISVDVESDDKLIGLLKRDQALKAELGTIDGQLAQKRGELEKKSFFKSGPKAEVAALTQSRAAKNAEVVAADAASTKRLTEVRERFSQFEGVIDRNAQAVGLELGPLNGKSYREFVEDVMRQLKSVMNTPVDPSGGALAQQESGLERAKLEYQRLYGSK